MRGRSGAGVPGKGGCGYAAGGVGIFFLYQYITALVRLGAESEGMKNKFSALARDKYMGFLIAENAYVLIAYGILAVMFTILLTPFLGMIDARWRGRGKGVRLMTAVSGAFLIHGYFTLRLVETRPYFLGEGKFGYWYYQILKALPETMKPVVFTVLFQVLPWMVLGFAAWWYLKRMGIRGRIVAGVGLATVAGLFGISGSGSRAGERGRGSAGDGRMNVLIIGSDSLRADRLGCNGYRPRRVDGLARNGVSPRIDELAARSVNFRNCFTPIASTLESGATVMGSQYPHTHGLRQMYPDRETVGRAEAVMVPIAEVMDGAGYDTAAFGDWCAGYYELMPMGFRSVSVSNFDNFKIYMSQAVVMAHFVIPLYFDHTAGYRLFPQLGSFAQFVTPEVVTGRVKERMGVVGMSGKPFFWHVFYSCNHLPYRSPEPYSSMFADPDYDGPNRTGVDFDIDGFIGGTDLENKWKALPEKEIRQIRDLYDGCTRQFDDNVGELLAALEENGLRGNTMVIVTADHGDNLYEEGVTLGHGLTFNGGLQANHVPLIFHVPGVGAREIAEHVRTIDLVPTIADLAGVEKPRVWEGRSFAGWLGGVEARSRAFYGETGFPFIQFRVEGVERPVLPPMDGMTYIDDSFNYQFVLKKEWEGPLIAAKQRCLMVDGWKMICTPVKGGGRVFQLFTREDGTGGTSYASAENADVYKRMKRALERWMDDGVETMAEEIFPDGG